VSTSPREVDRGRRVVAGVPVRVTELVWPDEGRSFQVYLVDGDVDLTENGCFDTMPTDAQITALLDQHPQPIPDIAGRQPSAGYATGRPDPAQPPGIRRWLTPAQFAAAVPALAAHPLPVLSHALARLRTTAVAALAAPDTDTGVAVYLVAPSYVLLVGAVDPADTGDDTQRHVLVAAPLAGATVTVPVPVVDVDTLLETLAEPGCAYLWPAGDSPYPDGWAHRAVTALQRAAGAARQAMGHDSEQDLNVVLPALADVLDDLAGIADGLTPYCGDFSDRAEARLGTVAALVPDAATMLRRAHHDVAARLRIDQRLPDLRLTEVVLRPDHTDHGWVWHAIGHLADQRADADAACQVTVITSHPHPSMGAAIDAVRDLARHCNASRPDPGDPAALLRLAAPTGALHTPDPAWTTQVAEQAARLRLRLPHRAAPADSCAGSDPLAAPAS
jgi:hypothetical protein